MPFVPSSFLLLGEKPSTLKAQMNNEMPTPAGRRSQRRAQRHVSVPVKRSGSRTTAVLLLFICFSDGDYDDT